MAGPQWEDDPRDSAEINAGAGRADLSAVSAATQRKSPTLQLVFDWHREIYKDAKHIPSDQYVGNIRDTDHSLPHLVGCQVVVGSYLGVDSSLVPKALKRFESELQVRIADLDRTCPAGTRITNPTEIDDVLAVAAWAHGEWIRIHPFVNGNGRTARLWALWCVVRYGLPPFIRAKPRPEPLGQSQVLGWPADAYDRASALSMAGQHDWTEILFRQFLVEALTGLR